MASTSFCITGVILLYKKRLLDAHSREMKMMLKHPRSVREFCKQNSI